MSDSLWPHELQHTRLPCPSLSPRVCSNSYLLSWWCHQPSHPLLPPSPPALNLSQHQGLFQWIRVIIFFWTTKHNWSPRQPFFQIDRFSWTSQCLQFRPEISVLKEHFLWGEVRLNGSWNSSGTGQVCMSYETCGIWGSVLIAETAIRGLLQPSCCQMGKI